MIESRSLCDIENAVGIQNSFIESIITIKVIRLNREQWRKQQIDLIEMISAFGHKMCKWIWRWIFKPCDMIKINATNNGNRFLATHSHNDTNRHNCSHKTIQFRFRGCKMRRTNAISSIRRHFTPFIQYTSNVRSFCVPKRAWTIQQIWLETLIILLMNTRHMNSLRNCLLYCWISLPFPCEHRHASKNTHKHNKAELYCNESTLDTLYSKYI